MTIRRNKLKTTQIMQKEKHQKEKQLTKEQQSLHTSIQSDMNNILDLFGSEEKEDELTKEELTKEELQKIGENFRPKLN